MTETYRQHASCWKYSGTIKWLLSIDICLPFSLALYLFFQKDEEVSPCYCRIHEKVHFNRQYHNHAVKLYCYKSKTFSWIALSFWTVLFKNFKVLSKCTELRCAVLGAVKNEPSPAKLSFILPVQPIPFSNSNNLFEPLNPGLNREEAYPLSNFKRCFYTVRHFPKQLSLRVKIRNL